jgi:acyl carrier protein
MDDMTLENSVVHQSLEVLGVQAPDNEDLCMYNTGLIDSFGVMQLVLQLEIETGTRLDLVDLMNNGVTITRIRFLLES